MNHIQHSPKRRVSPRVAVAVGLLAAGAVFEGIIAGSLTANAAPTASDGAAPTPRTDQVPCVPARPWSLAPTPPS